MGWTRNPRGLCCHSIVASTPAWAGRFPDPAPMPHLSVASTPAWAGRRWLPCGVGTSPLPPHPRGLDAHFLQLLTVHHCCLHTRVGWTAPCPQANRDQVCCLHTRVGWTLDPYWDLRVSEALKSFAVHVGCVWRDSPWEPMPQKRLPADTPKGQGQAF